MQGKIVIVADAGSFFTLYKVVLDAGLQPVQLLRGQRQQAAYDSDTASTLHAALKQTAATADCVLTSHAQLCGLAEDFPGDLIRHTIVYAPSPIASLQERFSECLEGLPCACQLLSVQCNPAQSTEQPQAAPQPQRLDMNTTTEAPSRQTGGLDLRDMEAGVVKAPQAAPHGAAATDPPQGKPPSITCT